MDEETKLCEYGCGQEAKFQMTSGKWCCESFYTKCPSNRKKNSENIKQSYINGKLSERKDSGFYQKIPSDSKNNMNWSKGLTKLTDTRVKSRSENLLLKYKNGEIVPPFLGKKHTEETKIKISENHNHDLSCCGGRGIKGWYKGFRCDSSWELAYVIYNLEHGIKFERNKQGFEYEFDGNKHKYYPDFILEDGTYIEIKGWLDDKNKAKIAGFSYILKIIDKNSIKPFLKFAKEKFGKDFTNLYQDYKKPEKC